MFVEMGEEVVEVEPKPILEEIFGGGDHEAEERSRRLITRRRCMKYS